MDLFGLGFGAFGILFIVMLVLGGLFIAAVVAAMVVVIVRNAAKAKQLGHDPLTMETELAARAIDSQLLTPERTLEDRLAELQDLHARGLIADDEYTAARARALARD